MNEKLLIDYASATLAKKKIGNLFNLQNTKNLDYERMVFEWNELLNEKNVYVEILNKTSSFTQIYTYRPDKLKKLLEEENIQTFLRDLGYRTNNLALCIDQLKDRIKNNPFPHEIGIFLGYPYEDVLGFIENNGNKFLVNCYWKVYQDKEEKLKIFNSYDKIKKSYKILFDYYKDIRTLCIG